MKAKSNPPKLSFLEEIRQSIRESNAKAEERNSEWEQRNRDWDKKMQALTDKIEATNKMVFGISVSNGAMAEEQIYNVLEKNKVFAGIKFNKILQKLPIVSKLDLEVKTELDVLLVNGNTVAIIEAKYKVERKHVTDLVRKKLNDFRNHFPEYSNHKVILGVGGMSFNKDAIQSANKKGIGIIKNSRR